MNANELRIGNWVLNDYTHKPQEVYGMMLHRLSKENDMGFIKPIPLTEEWLIKFGFDSNGDDNEYWVHDGMRNFSFLNQGVDFKVFDSGDVTVCFIKYVNQLQNLYFALTGEELVCTNS